MVYGERHLIQAVATLMQDCCDIAHKRSSMNACCDPTVSGVGSRGERMSGKIKPSIAHVIAHRFQNLFAKLHLFVSWKIPMQKGIVHLFGLNNLRDKLRDPLLHFLKRGVNSFVVIPGS